MAPVLDLLALSRIAAVLERQFWDSSCLSSVVRVRIVSPFGEEPDLLDLLLPVYVFRNFVEMSFDYAWLAILVSCLL